MSVKDIKKYYEEVAEQYLEMRNELKDFSELAEKQMFEPERLDAIKESIQPLMRNYEVLSYIMYLLNKPNKKEKQKKYEKMNAKLLATIKQGNTEDGVIEENENVIQKLKKQINA